MYSGRERSTPSRLSEQAVQHRRKKKKKHVCSLRIAESSPSYPPPPLLSPLNSLLSSFNMLSVNVSWRLRACTHRSARRPCLSLAACGSVRVPHRRGCEFVLQQVRPTWGRDTVASPFGGSRVPPAAYFNRQRRFLFYLFLGNPDEAPECK